MKLPEEITALISTGDFITKPRFFFYNIQTSPFAPPNVLFATVGDSKTKKFVQSGRLDMLLGRYFVCKELFHNYTGALIDCANSYASFSVT